MRKASKTFALIAGILTLVLSILVISISLYEINNILGDEPPLQNISIATGTIRILIPSIITSIAGVLGVIAALIVKKQNTAAGVLLIIGAVLCVLSILYLFNILFIIPIVLFICGSVFALKRVQPVKISPQPNMPVPPLHERKPGKVLGVIAGSFALLISILIFISNISNVAANPQAFENSNLSKALNVFLLMIPAIVNLFVGILGLTAAKIMKKRHTAAGVMMIVGAFICVFGFFNVISMVLLVIGSVFAIKPERPAQAPPQPTVPYISPEQLQP